MINLGYVALGIDPDRRDLLTSARFAVVAASATHGLAAPVDGVCTSLRDDHAVAADTRESVAAGFAGRLAVHPGQVAPIHNAVQPELQELDWARRVLVASEGRAAALVDGAMVDRPVRLRARALLARAGVDGSN